jgi:hypothetical protein
LHFVAELFQKFDKRDLAEIIPASLPEPIEYKSHREFVRKTLAQEVDLRASGTEFIDKGEESPDSPSAAYRAQINSEGSPSNTVAAGYKWKPGGEFAATTPDIDELRKKVA